MNHKRTFSLRTTRTSSPVSRTVQNGWKYLGGTWIIKFSQRLTQPNNKLMQTSKNRSIDLRKRIGSCHSTLPKISRTEVFTKRESRLESFIKNSMVSRQLRCNIIRCLTISPLSKAFHST